MSVKGRVRTPEFKNYFSKVQRTRVFVLNFGKEACLPHALICVVQKLSKNWISAKLETESSSELWRTLIPHEFRDLVERLVIKIYIMLGYPKPTEKPHHSQMVLILGIYRRHETHQW